MLITTECPACHNRYQVQASLRGVQIFCPNTACRKIFIVQEVGTPPGNGTSQVRGGVGDMVPLMTSEQAGPVVPPPSPPRPPTRSSSPSEDEILPVFDAEIETQPPATTSQPQSWKDPPPVRNANVPPPAPATSSPPPPAPPSTDVTKQPGSSSDWRSNAPPARGPAAPPPPPATATSKTTAVPPPKKRKRSSDSSTSSKPVVMPPGSWDPPPVRRSGEHPAAPPSQPQFDDTPPPRRRSRAWIPLILIPLIVLGLLSGGGWLLYSKWAWDEERLAGLAEKELTEDHFKPAADQFSNMVKKFPESARIEEYRFKAEYAALRAYIASTESDRDPPEKVLDKTSEFIRTKDVEALKPHAPKLGATLVEWLKKLVERVKQDITLSPKSLERGQEVLLQLTTRFPDALPRPERRNYEEQVTQTNVLLKDREERKALMDTLQQLGAKGTVEDIRKIQELASDRSRKEPGFANSPEVVGLIEKAKVAQLQAVEYHKQDVALIPGRGEDAEPGLLVEQLLRGTPPAARYGDPVVLALVRGVLYALSQTNGQIMWAMRVGIDTSRLPLVVPASAGRPEMVLAMSADTATLTALDSRTGDQLWQFPLSAPCLGQPVIVDQRAYIPTLDGRIHEIELVKGQLLGHFKVGSRLRLGGTVQEVTTANGRERLLYVPADEMCVYVLNLDPTNPRREAVLYTNHASGSLRGEPILAGPGLRDPLNGPAFLMLSQAEGLDAMNLRVWKLPITDGNAEPLKMKTGPRVTGWPWFAPHHDPDKLVLVTDSGEVGLFGLLQHRNEDNPLFPLVENRVRIGASDDNDPVRKIARGEERLRSQRAQVALSQGDDMWILANGWLQKLSLTFDLKAGPKAVIDPVWREPLRLGSPLHRTQTDATGSTLFTVTQAPSGNACVATAVDAATKQILWQRQLGLVVTEGEPVVLGNEVLSLESSSGVLAFHAKHHPRKADVQWQVGGRPLTRMRDGLAEPPVQAGEFAPWSMVVPGPDEKTAYELSCDTDPEKNVLLHVRKFTAGDDGTVSAEKNEKVIKLSAPPAGRPVLSATNLLVPLSNGAVVRVGLAADGAQTDGPAWRSNRRSPESLCFVAWLGPDEFLTTDGNRGVNGWSWKAGDTWRQWGENLRDGQPTTQIQGRIGTPPLVLSPLPNVRVLVADVEGGLTLLEGDKLTSARRWDLGGRITAGPFLRGGHVGCVVDRRRLVWLDPTKMEPLWTYKTAGDEIVGQPQLAGKVVVVADQFGKFVGLDPVSGKPRGPGYTLKANVAPAATPVALGSEQVFAPLTDGTVLLLGTKYFSEP